MTMYHGFEPIFDSNSRVLILGSFPSVKSRQTSFYYGNARNRFWTTLCEAFDAQPVTTTEEKKRLCLLNGIALWDKIGRAHV